VNPAAPGQNTRVAESPGKSKLPTGVAIAPGVTVLTGPARSGKTTAVAELYQRSLDELGRPRCLLIVPNAPAADGMRRRLLEQTPAGVLIAPAVTTFAGLAGSILAAAGSGAGLLSGPQRRLLLTDIVAGLHAQGRLKALGPLVDTPGLVSALDAAIAELKRAAVEPEALARAAGGDSDKDADLVTVYRLYQEHLLETNRFDVEGLMWLARDALAADARAPLGYERLRAVAVDGFTDFTPTQLEILAQLARRVERLVITLPYVPGPRRQRLWFWTARTLERIRQAIPAARVVAADEEADPLGQLFDLSTRGSASSRAGASEPGPSLTILAAADLETEVRAAARAVKADLAGGAPGGSVAVLARDLSAYAEPIQRIFAEHDVPVAPRPEPLAASSIVRYVLRLLSLPDRYESHDVLAAIKSSYFRPQALGEGFDQATVATAEMAIRTANVLQGRAAYVQALRRLAERARRAPAEDEQEEGVRLGPLVADAEAIERAAEMLEALMSALDELGETATPAGYAEAVGRLIQRMQVAQAALAATDETLLAADLRALEALTGLLADVARAEPAMPTGPAGFVELLGRLAAVAVCPAARNESLVTVLDVLDARALRFDRVYLLGVNEKAFPTLTQDRCFIGESDRAAWADRGVALDRRSDLIAREMLLFYLAATRAERALTVSYLSADSAGRAQAASGFVEDLASAAERQGMPCRSVRIGPGRFVSEPEDLASPREAFNAAIAAAFGDETLPARQARPLLGWARQHRPELLRRASFGILAAERRWRTAPPDAYDGRIDDEALLAALPRRFGEQRVFSATELNCYAQCPWSFFARYLLNLEPLAEPEAPMTPAARGSFCHAVLWRTMTALRDRTGGPVRLSQMDAADLRSALADAARAERRRLAEHAVYPALWEVQTRLWEEMLAAYLADQRDNGQPGEAVYFELGFGLPAGREERTDPASTAEPVAIRAGGRALRLNGKIDRVDRIEDKGPAWLLAIDYKSGRPPALKDILSGRDLQLALYAKALEALFDQPIAGGAYHDLREKKRRELSRLNPPRPRGGPAPDYEQVIQTAMNAAAGHVAGMQAGRFDALPVGDCPSFCPYRQICHYAPHRAERKAHQPGREGGHD